MREGRGGACGTRAGSGGRGRGGAAAGPRGTLALAAALIVAVGCRSDRTHGPGAAAPGGAGAGRGEAPAATPREPATPTDPGARGEPEAGRLAGVTAAHNRVREALGIAPLSWSPELARFAQAWADSLQRKGCQLRHRPRSGPDAQRYGENIFSSTGQAASPGAVVDAWAAEREDYDAAKDRCRGVCGHYTQVVWRKSQRLGCAMAACGDTEVWVCNYDPPGNFVGQRPY